MITCYFGLPGCGKSTMLAKIAERELRKIRKGKSKYWRIFSNYYIRGCYEFNFHDIGKYDMSGALILIDEITLDADSRDFKDFSYELKQAFILHRHYDIDIIYATQQFDAVDKKIRHLTAELFYLRKLGQISYAKAIFRKMSITEDSDIKMGYRFPTLADFVASPKSVIRLCYRPRYYYLFDSFCTVKLEKKKFKIYE